MTADEPVAGVPRLCARSADCTRPRGHDDECGPDRADTELADLRAEVERLRRNLQATSTDAIDAKCARDAARQEADQLNYLLGSHADGHRCSCEMTDPGVYHGSNMHPPEWEQDPWCLTHPDMTYVIDEHRRVEAERDALQRQVDAVRALAGEWLVEADRYEGYAAGSRIADELRSIAKTLRQNAAALDAVEPADQPHPGDADVVPAQVVTPESCPNHRPRQHRDGKPPWCELCRRTADGRIPVSVLDHKAGPTSEAPDLLAALQQSIDRARGGRPGRYDQCDDTCTTDCGHCKGTGRPADGDDR